MLTKTYNHLTAALRGAKGVIDLASILVGVVVIGLIGAGVFATVTMVIPWAQDNAAKSNLASVTTAQAVAQVQHESYFDYPGLVGKNLIQDSTSIDITVGDGCYIAVSQSASGKTFYSSSKAPAAAEYSEATDTSWCADAPEAPPANAATDFTWTTSGSEATITGYIGTSTDVVIPATYTTGGSDYDVTETGYASFYDAGLTSLVIPDSVVRIGGYSFSSNNLTSLDIPGGVTVISIEAFSENQLTSFTIPDGVTSIEAGAFQNNQLTSIAIPDSVTSVSNQAFMSNQLTSVSIPGSLDSIPTLGFADNKLASVTIPTGVTSIGAGAFTSNLLETVVISESVTNIGPSSFKNNLLTSITIPASVTALADAFVDNPFVTVYMDGDAPQIPYGATAFDVDDPNLTVHHYSEATGYTSSPWSDLNTVLR